MNEERKIINIKPPNELTGCGIMMFGCGFFILCFCLGIGGCTYLCKLL